MRLLPLGRFLLFSLLCCAALSSAALGQPAAPQDFKIDRYEWTGKIESGKTVRIENDYGDVRVRFGGYENVVEVHGALQQLHPEGAKLQVTSVAEPGGIAVAAGYPAARNSSEKSPVLAAPPGPANRADLVVFVPRGAAVRISTKAGLIDVRGVKSDVEAITVKGDILAKSVSGSIQARTDRGTITVVFEPRVTDKPQLLESVTGEIAVHLAEDADTDIRAETSGEISTDFSIQIEPRRAQEPDKLAVAKIGKGGRALALESKRGRIRIFRRPKLVALGSL